MPAMKSRKVSKPTRSDYTPQTAAPLDPNAVSELRFKLLNAGSPVPAVHALAHSCFENSIFSPVIYENLPDTCSELSSELAYCSEVEIRNNPVPVASLSHQLFDTPNSRGFESEKQRFITSVKYSELELKQIPKITMGQSQNCEWYRQRMGAITASTFGSVMRFIQSGRGNVDRLIKNVQNYEQRSFTKVPQTNVPALKWGLKCESVALKSYQMLMKPHHKDLVINKTGLHVCAEEQFLRASPDGLMSCSCHREKQLVEVKCPWSARNIDPCDAVANGTIKYIREENGTFSLIPGHPSGYYEQVQGTMAITGTKRCNFVVWTLAGVLVLPVEFDEDFWADIAKPMLVKFFNDYVVDEILTERVWRGLPLWDYRSVCRNTESLSDDDVVIQNDTDEILTAEDLGAQELEAASVLVDTDFDMHLWDMYDYEEEIVVDDVVIQNDTDEMLTAEDLGAQELEAASVLVDTDFDMHLWDMYDYEEEIVVE